MQHAGSYGYSPGSWPAAQYVGDTPRRVHGVLGLEPVWGKASRTKREHGARRLKTYSKPICMDGFFQSQLPISSVIGPRNCKWPLTQWFTVIRSLIWNLYCMCKQASRGLKSGGFCLAICSYLYSNITVFYCTACTVLYISSLHFLSSSSDARLAS